MDFKDFKKSVFNNIIGGIITIAINLVSSVFLTYLKYGIVINFSFFNKVIETYFNQGLILLIILILTIIIIKLIRRKMLNGFNPNIGEFYGCEKYMGIAPYKYNELIWEIKAQEPKLFSSSLNYHVNNSPFCPKFLESDEPCYTPLNFEKHYLWYTWHCSYCGYKHRTWECRWLSKENVDREVEGFIRRNNIKTLKKLQEVLFKNFRNHE